MVLHLLMLFAFIGAGISPACKFISGAGSYTEICTADGLIKKIAAPAVNDGLPDPDTHSGQPGQDCAFCFAQTHQAADGLPDMFVLAAFPPPADPAPGFHQRLPEKFGGPALGPRGPPASL